jgi:cation diffusion facilitator CzcD-associated flavoprotein CzcO
LDVLFVNIRCPTSVYKISQGLSNASHQTQAKKVTLIQRSPAWIVNVDGDEKSTRTYKTYETLIDYFHSRIFKKSYKKKVLAKYPYYNDTNVPSYDFWDQRPACSLNNDYFDSVKSEKVSLELSEVENWEANGIKLKNGNIINCDLKHN